MAVDEHTIILDQSPVFYRRGPAPGVPALYLHGIPTSSDDWLAFLERTGGVAPDLPGFGRTGKGGHLDYSLEGHADFLERLLEELALEQVQLVAHDWGAGGGLLLAQRHPERVQRLVLINALPLLAGYVPQGPVAWLRRPLVGELVMGATTRGLLARTLRRGCVDPQALSDRRLAEIWEQFDQGTQRAILRLYRAADESRLQAAGAHLSELNAAALVVWGEGDPWFSTDFAHAYTDRLAHASLHTVSRAGHWPWLEQPEVVERVAEFLAS